MTPIFQNFREQLDSRLRPLEQGVGRVEHSTTSGLRLHLADATNSTYSNAQIDDYQGRPGPYFVWVPPLRMEVQAWASHNASELKGTAGFGFWTQPVMSGRLLPILPRSLWFFFNAAPSNIKLVRDIPAHGWKAATMDAGRAPFLALAPFSPIGFLLMRHPTLYHRLWPIAQWAIGAAEAPVPVDFSKPHTYRLDWLNSHAEFFVDDKSILRTPFAPRGPLGFVAWLDNRYAVVTPQGKFGMALFSVPGDQWLQLESLRIAPLPVKRR